MLNFDNCSGGFPTEVTQILRHNRVSQVIHTVNPWFSVTFTDGLYIDYGAVDGFFELGGRYPGGRFAFKRYYDQYRRLRSHLLKMQEIFRFSVK